MINYFEGMINPQTKKPVQVREAYNDWLWQVIVDNKLWTTVYYAKPPQGDPSFIAESFDQAHGMAHFQAYQDTVVYFETLRMMQGSDTQDRPSF